MKRMILAALAASAFVATPAFAADQATFFTGNRAIECSVAGLGGTVNFGTLGRNGEASPVTRSLTLFCNQPFKASVTSANGYLKLQTSDGGALNSGNNANSETDLTSNNNPGFAAGVDYGISSPIVFDNATRFLTAGVPADGGLGTIPAQNLPTTNVSFDTRTSGVPLLGGTYSDTITVTLTPQGV